MFAGKKVVVRGAYGFWGAGDCEDRLEVLGIPFKTQQFPDRTSGKGTTEQRTVTKNNQSEQRSVFPIALFKKP